MDDLVQRLYADRDHQSQGGHYLRHIRAMTAEGLYAKSEIAGELAHRDMEIERLRAENDALRADAMRATAEPVAHICILPTTDGPRKFLTTPSDQRGFPVYAAPPKEQT